MIPVGTDDAGNLVYEDGIEPIVIRTTERTNFKKCRRLWDYTSKIRRNLEPVKMNHNLAFGIAIHKGLEGYYDPETWDVFDWYLRMGKALSYFREENLNQMKLEAKNTEGGLSQERIDEYDEREELGVEMLRGYAKWAQENDNFTPIFVEQKFQIPVVDYKNGEPLVIDGRPVVYQVRIDLVLEDNETGYWWILDHKTTGRLSDREFLELDVQISSYAWAAQTYYNRQFAGVIYNELLKQVPKPPKLLKSGKKLSVDKQQITTYELYIEAIEEYGFDPEDYEDMLDYLLENPREFFRRTPVTRSQRELALQGQHVVDEAFDMMNSPRIYPNPSKMNCNYCDFRHPCITQTEGGDVDFVLTDSFLYRTRPEEDNEYEDMLNAN